MYDYIKVPHFGEPLSRGITDGHVYVEEKVDGSQFRVYIPSENKPIQFGSHHQNITTTVPKMFEVAVESAKKIFSPDRYQGYTFYCEFLSSKKHNTLVYNRVPENNLMLFDAYDELHSRWVFPSELPTLAHDLGIEAVPILGEYDNISMTELTEKLNEFAKNRVSILGGEIIEGVVIKNYSKLHSRHDEHGPEPGLCQIVYWNSTSVPPQIPYMAKYVRPDFRERNNLEWNRKRNPDLDIALSLATSSRFTKVINHAREQGLPLTDTMKDVSILLKVLEKDFTTEDKLYVQEKLWDAYNEDVWRQLVKQFVTWYKEKTFKQKLNMQ